MIGCKNQPTFSDSSQTNTRTIQIWASQPENVPATSGIDGSVWHDMILSYIISICHVILEKKLDDVIWVDMMWCHMTSQKTPNWPVDRGHSPGSLPHKSVWPDGLKMAHHLKPWNVTHRTSKAHHFWASTLVFSGDWPSMSYSYDSPLLRGLHSPLTPRMLWKHVVATKVMEAFRHLKMAPCPFHVGVMFRFHKKLPIDCFLKIRLGPFFFRCSTAYMVNLQDSGVYKDAVRFWQKKGWTVANAVRKKTPIFPQTKEKQTTKNKQLDIYIL